MNLKERIIELLEEFEKGKYSNLLLNDYFNKNNINQKEKAFITEVFYGVIRNLIFLDYQIENRTKKIKKSYLKQLLRISFYQLTFMNSEEKAVVWEGAELAKKYGEPVSKFINSILRNYTRDSKNVLEETEKKDWGIRYSYPLWFVEKTKKTFGKRSLDILKSLKETPYLSVRYNRLKMNENEFVDFLKKEKAEIIKQVEDVFYVSKSLINTAEFKEGKIIVQDGSSFLAAKILGAQKGETILDTCSAPGSKSLVIAHDMGNNGSVFSLDIFEHKIKLIKENAEKMGVTIINTILMDATECDSLKEEFDRILVDAPCSGFGVIRKKPETLYNKNLDNIEELSQLQYKILESASKKLKKGGILVYSTCTIFPEENQENAEKFLKNNPDFETIPFKLPEEVDFIEDELKGKTIIDKYLDGFYIIKFRRKED